MKFKMGGSGIYIKPENKGKFTATKKATGKSTEELTHSKNPVTKKRAVFAQNATKWKHEDGSKNVKSFPDLNKDGKISKADVLVGRGVIPTKKMQMGNKSTKSNSFVSKDKMVKELGDPTRVFKKAAGLAKDLYKKPKETLSKLNPLNNVYEDLKTSSTKNKVSKKMQEGSKELKTMRKNLPKSMTPTPDNLKNKVKGVVKGVKDFIKDPKKTLNKLNPIDNAMKSMDKKMCGSKGMKYAEGTKSIKFKKPMMKRADGSTSQRGLWDNIRANKGSGKKPTPEMLKQEKKIKAKTGK